MYEGDAFVDTVGFEIEEVETAAANDGARFAGEVDEFSEGAAYLCICSARGYDCVVWKTHVNSNMADHICMMGQSDIFVFPVNIFTLTLTISVDRLIVHYERTLNIDLDRGRLWWSFACATCETGSIRCNGSVVCLGCWRYWYDGGLL